MVLMDCPSDNQLKVRVNPDCRAFDFPLLFEDAVFRSVPSIAFLLLLLPRLKSLARSSSKSTSFRLAAYKLVPLFVLFLLRVVYTGYQVRTAALHTTLSTPAAALEIAATLAALILSFLEDRRSIKPSDVLILYFSSLTVLDIPRLRTLWLIASIPIPRGLFTAIYAAIVLIVVLESLQKTECIRAVYRDVSIEQLHGFWGRNLFIWTFPLFRDAYRHIISLDDLPEVDSTLLGASAGLRLHQAWQKAHGKYRLIKAVFRAYAGLVLAAVIPRILLAGFTFCQPFLIAATINYITEPPTPENKRYGQALVGAYAIVYSGLAASTAAYYRQASRLATVVRSGLIAMISEQTLRLKSAQLQAGNAVTLMGTDTERIVVSVRTVHELWASLASVGVAIWLLEIQVYVACVVPAVMAVGCILATTPVSARCAAAQKKWVGHVQERLAVTAAMLGDMKAVKMLGLERILYKLVSDYRKVELRVSRKFRTLMVGVVMLSTIPQDLTPYMVFLVYTIIALAKGDMQLLTTQAFTTLSLISILTGPLMGFIQSVPRISQSIGCFDRIQEYCSRERTSGIFHSAEPSDSIELTKPSFTTAKTRTGQDSLVTFHDASISWEADSEPVLHDLTLSVPTGKITMVIGPVGCGKSSLLETIMGQTHVKAGSIHRHPGGTAYCPQIPWIMNTSIRDNVTGGTQADQKWYDLTIAACALAEDLEKLAGGDLYIAGSDGVTLSGGQKQRVALARVVYSRLPHVILDDPFSGLDSGSIRTIGERLLGANGLFRRASATVVLSTHNRSLLPYADEIILLENGRKAIQCTYPELISRHPQYTQANGDDTENTSEGDELQGDTATDKNIAKQVSTGGAGESADIKEDLTRRDGSWGIYSYYSCKAGLLQVGFFAVCFLAYGTLTQFSTIWLQWWSDANEHDANSHLGKYLGVYTVISMASILLMAAGTWLLLVDIVGNTSLGLHSDLLQTVLSAPFAYFQHTDTGSILNRFSQDMELIDFALPVFALNFIEALSICIVSLVILCIIGKYIAIALPFMLLAFWALQRSYLRTSRQVRLLDIEAKAPLYLHFQETLHGLGVLQSLQWQSSFHSQCITRLDATTRPFYMLFCIRQGLKLALDLVVMLFVVALVAIVTSLKDRFSAGGIGVALNLVIAFSSTLNTAIESWTQMEISLGAVARVQRFVEEVACEETQGVEDEWLTGAEIVFENVVAGYSPNRPILTNVTLHIRAGQKVAVCGASGSGKTSLILALLRMMDVHHGRITIDGTALSAIKPTVLRSQIAVIPQDPFFIPGTTLRFNLSPTHSPLVHDERMVSALRKVGLWDRVHPLGGLDALVDALELSYGSKQLLALARALVLDRPLLILDEATSGVDWETEARMLDIIETECATQTVIAVMHRLRHVERLDRIAVLQDGQLIEFDAPDRLLARESRFRELYTMSSRGV